MSRYLEEAATILRNASAANEEVIARYGDHKSYAAKRIEIAREFATLAAIDKGLLPADITRDVLDNLTRQHA